MNVASKNVCLPSTCPEVPEVSCFFDPILFVVIRVFQPYACAWCCNTKTSASSVLLSQLCIHLMLTLHFDTCALRMAQVRSEKDHIHGSGAFALTHKILALPCLWSKPSTNCSSCAEYR